MHTNQDVQIGKLVEGDPERDAIHVAVTPIVAAEKLQPGSRVGMDPRGRASRFHYVGDILGVVDPFLQFPPNQGDKFWLFLYPNTITGMRHHWRHPAFEDHMDEEEKWARGFAEKIGFTLERLMSDCEHYILTEEPVIDNSESYNNASMDDWERFWRYYSAKTGVKVKHDYAPYKCSC